MSFMSKFKVQGRDAGRLLNRLSTADVDGAAGRITYCQWLNDDGRMEADVTVAKLADDEFLVVATDTMHRHVETWARRQCPAGWAAVVTDVTAAYAQINVQGPRSRDVVQAVTAADLGGAAFPFGTAREIPIGYASVLCTRITYVGELGYELFVPTEQAVHVYDRLVEAGRPHGLRHAGLRALGSLRLEKAYRDYGHDMDNTDSITAVGLAWTCAMEKPGGFIGDAAVRAQRAAGPPAARLVQVLVSDPEPLMFGAEVLLRDGVAVGDIRAASYGHTLGGAVGLGWVADPGGAATRRWLDAGRWEVEIAGARHPCAVSLRPLYDPGNARIRA